jgi:hypothetical protein
MPCDCELDLERRWARAWGVVTLADAMANRKKFMSLPGFEPDFCQLYDGRRMRGEVKGGISIYRWGG